MFAGSQKSVSTKYFHSFGIRAARLWNALPKEVNTAETLDFFKVMLEQWLEQFPDCPPVKGFTSHLTELYYGLGDCSVERGMFLITDTVLC